jgi:four helix bundle protein
MNDREIRSYRDLQVWQRAVNLSVKLYRSTETFPKSEIYGLTGQMRRSAVSIASNIAEGHARTRREYGRFLGIALGSLAELETQLEISHRLDYLTDEVFIELNNEITILGKQLNVLSQRIKS